MKKLHVRGIKNILPSSLSFGNNAQTTDGLSIVYYLRNNIIMNTVYYISTLVTRYRR